MGVPFQEVDLTTTPNAMEYVTEDLGYSQAPIIVVDDHFHWAGLRPDLIEQVATLHAANTAGASAGGE
ncbi:hypothetical protein GCM10009648_14640 [Tsukamurella spumae]